MPILYAILVLGLIGAALGACIGVASKLLYVEDDPRVEVVVSKLPGANCGGCGYPGCAGFADAIVFEGANPSGCKPSKAEVVAEIKAYLKAYEEEHK